MGSISITNTYKSTYNGEGTRKETHHLPYFWRIGSLPVLNQLEMLGKYSFWPHIVTHVKPVQNRRYRIGLVISFIYRQLKTTISKFT